MGAIWPDGEPAQSDTALDAILSKLRAMLKSAQLGGSIDVSSGTIALQLPGDAWIDLEAASNALDEAEGALRRNDRAEAWSLANVAVARGRLADHAAVPGKAWLCIGTREDVEAAEALTKAHRETRAAVAQLAGRRR